MDDQQTTNEVLELGTWLGRRQAFSYVAGRCSAADAKCLKQMREEKRYLALDMNWEGFCKQKVGISRATADRLIRHLEEFGPNYFELAALANMPVEQYRMIAPAVTDAGLTFDGETIEIKAENAPRLTAAVEKLRERAVDKTPASSGELVKTWKRARKSLAAAVETYARALALATAAHDRAALRADMKNAGLELYEKGGQTARP